MQTEYGTDDLVIFGVNHPEHSSSNDTMSDGNDIGLLQDDTATDAWGLWTAEWRDIYVLDADGALVGVLNLTDNDLRDEAGDAAVRELIDSALP